MSFGGKKSTPAAPTATFTPVAAPVPQQSANLNTAEAQARAASPQGASSLLADDEEAKRRAAAGGAGTLG